MKITVFRLIAVTAAIICGSGIFILARLFVSSAVNYRPNGHLLNRYRALSDSPYKFNRDFGFDYMPNKQVMAIGVSRNQIQYCWKGMFDSEGNVSTERNGWDESNIKVLAAGDSFTANPFGPDGSITWTDYFPSELMRLAAKKIAIKNFGRDGYGIMQEIHMANVKAKVSHPDFVIIAFIADDMLRPRIWRFTRRINNQIRAFLSYSNDVADVKKCADLCFISPLVTSTLCSKPLNEQRVVIQQLNKEYRYLQEHYERQSLSRPHLSAPDVVSDTQFIRDLDELHASHIPFLLVYLPTLDEIDKGHRILKKEEQQVLEFVEHRLGQTIMDPFTYFKREMVTPDCFLSPFDGHPTRKGARLFAQYIAHLIVNSKTFAFAKS